MNNSVSEIARIWEQTLKIIDERLQERQIFDTFFADTFIHSYEGESVVVMVKNFTSQRLLSSKYIDLVKEAFFDVTEKNCNFKFVLPEDIAKSNTNKVLLIKKLKNQSSLKTPN